MFLPAQDINISIYFLDNHASKYKELHRLSSKKLLMVLIAVSLIGTTFSTQKKVVVLV